MKVILVLLISALSVASASWSYTQSTGRLTHNGSLIGTGYSGTGTGRNNPSEQCVSNEGPIPRGTYSIGTAYTDATKGPVVMRLTPTGTQDMCGRSAFLIHGDNTANDASQGCIILSRDIRDQISASTDRVLEVV